ncbi:hypothetical protein L7F22_007495 [Adiantum nelumboides]|nr:hypothetical protein [Adiantum nelumboides]
MGLINPIFTLGSNLPEMNALLVVVKKDSPIGWGLINPFFTLNSSLPEMNALLVVAKKDGPKSSENSTQTSMVISSKPSNFSLPTFCNTEQHSSRVNALSNNSDVPLSTCSKNSNRETYDLVKGANSFYLRPAIGLANVAFTTLSMFRVLSMPLPLLVRPCCNFFALF